MSNHRTTVDTPSASLSGNNMPNQTHTVSHSDMNDTDAGTVYHDVASIQHGSGHSDIHAPPPSALSWFSDEEDLSPRASKYFSDLFALYEYEYEAIGAARATTHTDGARPASTVTLFPGCTDSNLEDCDAEVTQHKSRQNESKRTENRSFFKKHYERAKQACRDAPPGETDLFWAGVKSYLEAKKKAAAVSEIYAREPANNTKFAESQNPNVEQQAAGRSLPTMANTSTDADCFKKRQDSVVSYGDISRSSREVPVKLLRTALVVDVDKPLPPSPPLDAIPKQHCQKAKDRALDVNKPLPRTPLPCLSERPRPSYGTADESPIDPPWSITQAQSVGQVSSKSQTEVSQQYNLAEDGRLTQASTRSQPLAKKSSITGKSKPSKADKAHEALKAKISRPIAIPPAVKSSPSFLKPNSGTLSEKAKGKQKRPSSPNWLDKLPHPIMPALHTTPIGHRGKKRPDSHESFACQGVSDAEMFAMYLGDGGPSVQDEGPKMRGEDLVPVPLFTGTNAGGGRSKEGGYDVEDGEFRRAGRWI